MLPAVLANVTEPRKLYSGRVVWIIDDDPTVLRIAEGQLNAQGFRVRSFADPQQALQDFPSSPPDIVVLDVMIPGTDGFEICSTIRAFPGGTEVPILMVTALEDANSINRGFEAGATDFALKPINWPIETHRLRYMLRSADTARALRLKESEMRQSRENWERTFNAISDVVTVLDNDLRVVRANAFTSASLGKPLPEIIGHHCFELFQGRNLPCEACPVLRTFATGTSQSGEIPYSRPGGDMLITGSPVTNPDGRVGQVVHVAHDLSQHKLLEEKLRQSHKLEAIGTLAGGIAHEFNNLLQVVLAWAELLAADATTPEMTSGLSAISDAAKRGRALSEQLLTFSRRGSQRPDRRPIDLNRLAEDLMGLLPRILPRSVKLELSLGGAPALVNADSSQMQQVVLNLSANAAQAMPDGGLIHIAVREVQLPPQHEDRPHGAADIAYVLLEVRDSGHGMDKRTLARIFDPFFTTRTVGQGTGLGLSIVYGIVKEHGGHIVASSEEGKGSTFRVYLPAYAPVPPLPPSAIGPEAASSSPARILVVDDEAPIRIMMQRFLARAGYEVTVAADGEEALRLYEDANPKPSLVILDVGMPGMGGVRCLEALRKLDPQARVLVATGYGLDDIRDKIRALGALALIPKPYELKEISERIQELLPKRSPP
jgi:signal transduction histidine kinase